MLVLKRKMNERIVVEVPPGAGGILVITLVEVERLRAKLGFECPREWKVDREEVRESKLADALAAGGAPSPGPAAAPTE